MRKVNVCPVLSSPRTPTATTIWLELPWGLLYPSTSSSESSMTGPDSTSSLKPRGLQLRGEKYTRLWISQKSFGSASGSSDLLSRPPSWHKWAGVSIATSIWDFPVSIAVAAIQQVSASALYCAWRGTSCKIGLKSSVFCSAIHVQESTVPSAWLSHSRTCKYATPRLNKIILHDILINSFRIGPWQSLFSMYADWAEV